MGFNSSFTGREEALERETLEYLQTLPALADQVARLILELKRVGRSKKSLEAAESGIRVGVRNQRGQEVLLTVVGLNSTSLISSEMEGHLAFMFIKNISSLEIMTDTMNVTGTKERRFTLIKN